MSNDNHPNFLGIANTEFSTALFSRYSFINQAIGIFNK